MLKLKNVSKYYYQNGVVAKGLINVNLELHMGEFVVITGESGSGKSTLLNILSGLDSYEDGEMYINGKETSHYTEEDYLNYRRSYVSNIFQNFNLVNSYTVYENIELALLMNGYAKKEVKNKVLDLIDKVGLNKFKNTKASKLSGGQKQRVAIARCLASDTPIIVADEPTGSLDSEASKSILEILHNVSKDKLVIVVTHNKKEIEKYATRLIKMSDGRIIENKVIEEINKDKEVKEVSNRIITSKSKYLLGFRNAFNIPVKFILMFIIFLLISITLISNYGAFKLAQYEENSGYSRIFYNTDNKRIIISKDDYDIITDEDYEQIKNIKDIDYIVKEDLLNDYELYLNSDYLYLNGLFYLKDIDEVSLGRMPKEKNEIIFIGNKNSYYLEYEDILDKEYNIDGTDINVKIVGILYDDSYNNYTNKFYLSKELRDELLEIELPYYSNVSVKIDNQNIEDLQIKISEKVPEGFAYLSEFFFKDYQNKEININNQNIYYHTDYQLTIKDTYNIDNIKKLNVTYENDNIIYISRKDYNKIFKKDNYQSSVFVKDISVLKNVKKELNKMGYQTFLIRDNTVRDGEFINKLFNVLRVIVTIILILTLFFIAYFLIRIIYKSRNSYYATLRSLGSSKKVCISILMNEMFTLATFTYGLFIIFLCLVQRNIINLSYFKDITRYVRVIDYIIVYLILLLLSLLISLRYGRKIFKNSIIKTYKEEE